MARKPGSPRQQTIFRCHRCNFVSKRNSSFVLHMKETHGVEL